MISTFLIIFSAATAAWSSYEFLTDPYSVYLVARKVKNSFRQIKMFPAITSVENEWDYIEDWEMIEL